MSEADDAARWARLLVCGYGLDDLEHLAAQGVAMTVVERAEFQLIFEKLAYLESMAGPDH